MFDTKKNLSILREYELILIKKVSDIKQFTESDTKASTNSNSDSNAALLVKSALIDVNKQLELLSFLQKTDEVQLSFLLGEITKYLTNDNIDYLEAMEKVQGTKERMLIDSLKSNLDGILTNCKTLRKMLYLQSDLFNYNLPHTSQIDRLIAYKQSLEKEEKKFKELKQGLSKDSELELLFTKNISEVKKIVAKDAPLKLFRNFVRGMARIKYKILPPIGLGNVPSSGPVIFAPRHYNINTDVGVVLDSIPRRTFILNGAEAFRTEKAAKWYSRVFEKSGFIPVIRPESVPQYGENNTGKMVDNEVYRRGSPLNALKKISSILSLNQAVLIFPEGHANIALKYTPKELDDGIIELKDGLVIGIELAQRASKKDIPVIPIGIIYDPNTNSLQANFGKPIYHIISSKMTSADVRVLREEFNKKLRDEIARLSNVGLTNIKSREKEN